MIEQTKVQQVEKSLTEFYLPGEEQIRKLRQIIRAESGFKFTYKDAEEVGYELIALYQHLARGRPIVDPEAEHEAPE